MHQVLVDILRGMPHAPDCVTQARSYIKFGSCNMSGMAGFEQEAATCAQISKNHTATSRISKASSPELAESSIYAVGSHVEAEVSEHSKFCRESPKPPRSCRYSVAILCTRLIGHGTVIANDDDPEMQEIKDSWVRYAGDTS